MGEPVFVAERPEVDYPATAFGKRKAGAAWRLDDDPPRRDDRRGGPVRMRQDDLAARR